MPDNLTTEPKAIQQAFLENERGVRIQNYKLSCIVALVFMPAGASLDYMVYPKLTPYFFGLRLACSSHSRAAWGSLITVV